MSIFGWSYPPGCSGPPDEDAADDSVCAWCGATLPEDCKPSDWAFDGFCDAECALLQQLSDLGVAHGMECTPRLAGIREIALRAVSELAKR